MPESTCLHLQDQESSPIHVVEIPWISVRIGRAAYCEVRLADRDVAEEACRLQRRGRTWYLVPLGPKGSIRVHDQPIEGPCPLPFDVPFRVGASCLTLRRSRATDPDWAMYQTPSPSHCEWPSAASPAMPLSSYAAPSGVASIMASQPQAASSELSRAPSATRLEPASNRPAVPESVNPWEARWKAAGARLLATAGRPRTLDRYHPPQPLDRNLSVPLKEPSVPLSRPAEATLSPTALREFEPHLNSMAAAPAYPCPPSAVPYVRPVSDLASRPLARSTELWQVTPRLHPPANLDEEPATSLETADQALTLARSVRTGSETSAELVASLSEQHQPEATVRDICHEPACCEVEFHASIVSIEEANLGWSETGSSSLHDLSAWIEYYLPHKTLPPPTAEGPSKLGDIASNPAPTGLACSMPIVQGVAIPCEENDLPAPSSLPGCERETSLASHEEVLAWITPPIQHFVADTSWPNTVPFVETGVSPMIASATAEVPPTANLRQGEGEGSEATGPAHVRTVTLLNSHATMVDDRCRQIEEKSQPANSWPRSEMRANAARLNVGLHLPSAKDILAAAPRKSSPQPRKHSGQVGSDQATPTVPQAPGAWSLPIWLAWPPAALLVLVMGVIGSLLSVRWASDSYNASVVNQRLIARTMSSEKEKPLPESVAPPDSSWWQTTALHLAQWGIYLSRAGSAEDRTEEARDLLEAAIRISPINPTARLARAQLGSQSTESTRLAWNLGLSRDAASLAYSARALRLAGKKQTAIRAYGQALQIACHFDLEPTPDLGFSDDPSVCRYFLPGETTTLAIIRELATDADWPVKEWSTAVPRNSVATLAAARLLREQGKPEAQDLLKQILDDDQARSTSGRDRAIRLAMRAEAHALLSQWNEAEQRYRQAIDLIQDPTIKRSWWFNLASIAFQLNDEAQRKAALAAALDVTNSDDISRRSLELQRVSQPLGRLRSSGTRAN